MQRRNNRPIREVALALFMGVSAPVWAQAPKPAPVPAPARTQTPSAAPAAAPAPVAAPAPAVALTVNGAAITEKEIDNILSRSIGQGQAPTQQMRDKAITEAVVQRVLLDEAKRMKLDATPAYAEKLEELRQMVLIESLVNDFLSKYPITAADEKTEYDRQKKILGNGTTTQQYQLRQVIVKTEQEGRDLIGRAQKGEAFEKLAELSLDPNGKVNGGNLGWVFPTDLLPILGAVVVNLQKGSVAAAPIQSPVGWHVLKLDDTRPYKIPAFEDSRAQMRQAVLTQRRQEMVDGLVKKAVIRRP